MADSEDTKYPHSTEGVRGLLNMDGTADEQPPIQPAGAPPDNLPFMEDIEQPVKTPQTEPEIPPHVDGPLGAPAPAGHTGPLEQITVPADRKGGEMYSLFLYYAKTILPYIVIFIIGLGLYSFYFSDFSFYSLFKNDNLKIQDVTNKNKNKEVEALKKDVKGDYDKWISQFFFDVNDDSITSMDTDVSGNGLTNFEKYLLNLNPKVYSTRGTDGDGSLVLQNINPWTGKQFTDEQKTLIDKYINKELISNRIAIAALTRGVTKFAQYVNEDSPYYIDPNTLREVNKNNPVITNPGEAVSPGYIPEYKPSDSGTSGNGNRSIPQIDTSLQINQKVPGRIEIPDNKISVPLIWTQDPANFDKDLKSGTVHYPGTAMPGETGTAYISGHSSGYVWDHSPYKQIFAGLGQVKDGASFIITVQLNNGSVVKYHYVVERRGEFAADDQTQFISTADSIAALSTCWPVGTTNRRLVLFGKLTQTERS